MYCPSYYLYDIELNDLRLCAVQVFGQSVKREENKPSGKICTAGDWPRSGLFSFFWICSLVVCRRGIALCMEKAGMLFTSKIAS